MSKRIPSFEILNPREGDRTSESNIAEDALRALAGHVCYRCGNGLSRANGYACCEIAHCPICGLKVGTRVGCEHVVAMRTSRLALLCGRGAEFALPAPPRWAQWNHAVWSDAQLRDAYGDHFDAAQAIFGADFDSWDKKHFRAWLLEHALSPDISTAVPYLSRTDRYWFSYEPKSAAKKLFALLAALRRANARLHTQAPLGTTTTKADEGESDGTATGTV